MNTKIKYKIERSDNMDCLFCKINEDLIPSKTLFEDEIVKVFMDINPESDGHVLIVPKAHIADIMDADKETIAHMFEVSKRIKEDLYRALSPDGLTFMFNYGLRLEVPHLHLHLIPVYKSRELHNIEAVYEKIKKQINLSNLMN